MIDYNNKKPLTGIEDDKWLFSEVVQEVERREKMGKIKSFGLELMWQFDSDVRRLAKKIEEEFGIPWEVTYWQAALETGFGKHAPNNNYFGIKWPGGWFQTKEYLNWQWVTINDSFRGYSSMEESFIWYAQFLHDNKRYRNAFLYKDDPRSFLQEIKNAWYATDPNYVSKIESIWTKMDVA